MNSGARQRKKGKDKANIVEVSSSIDIFTTQQMSLDWTFIKEDASLYLQRNSETSGQKSLILRKSKRLGNKP